MKSFYVVSDTWMGRAHVLAANATDAAQHVYEQRLAQEGYEAGDDQTEVLREQFRAGPIETFPEHLSFSEAFKALSDL